MISQPILDDITRRLVAEFAPERVILFGSQAWGSPTEDSDVDLMVLIKESSESAYRLTVRAHRALTGISHPKDVLVETCAEFDRRASVKASLERKISERGRVLYG